jgi:hypothetical protein
VVSKRRTGTPQVHTITSARAPLNDDIARRARRYMFQMSLRTVCFLGAVFTWGRVPTPVSATLLVCAVILPYVAVVLANAGRERPEQADPFLEITRQLGSGPATPPGSDAPGWDDEAPRWDDRRPRPGQRDDGARWHPDGNDARWDQGDRSRWQHGDRTRHDGNHPDGQPRG